MNRDHRRKLVLAAITLLQVEAGLAQGPDEDEDLALAYGDKVTISIATGTKQALRRAPAVATVITVEDIKAMGATDLDEVIRSVPGVHVTRAAPSGYSTYSIRGITGNPTNPQVLMLQNGIPTNDLYRGDRGEASGAQPLENVARIEIIRGPGSALYGADAFSGVINIITKTAADTPGTEFGVRGGSFNTRNAWVQHGGKLGDIDIAAFLRIGHTDGARETITSDAATRLFNILHVSQGRAPGSMNDGQDDVDANLDVGYDKWRLRAGYRLRNNLGTGAGISSALDPVGSEKSQRINADVSWTDAQFTQHWGLGFTGSYLAYSEVVTTFNLYPPGTSFGGPNVFPNGMIGSPGRWQRQIRASGYATYSGFDGQNLRFGVGHEDMDLYDVRTMKNFFLNAAGTPTPDLAFNGGNIVDYSTRQPHLIPHRRFNDYYYAQDEWNFARDWTLTAGLRHDNFSDFGATTNPRLALVWDTTLDFTSKLLYGQAFRAPSFAEQYTINPVANGNPNLKPETIGTLEAAFAWQVQRDTLVNLSIFRYNVKDSIRAVANPTAGTGSTFANTGKVNGHGAEFEAVWDPSRTLRITGSYSYQKSIDEATDTDAGYAPRNQIYARADWRFSGNWMLSPQVHWAADTKRAINDTRPDVPASTTVDLTLRTDRTKGQWSFAASVRNLFNAANYDPSLYVAAPPGRTDIPTSAIPNDLPLPGRSLYLEATYRL